MPPGAQDQNPTPPTGPASPTKHAPVHFEESVVNTADDPGLVHPSFITPLIATKEGWVETSKRYHALMDLVVKNLGQYNVFPVDRQKASLLGRFAKALKTEFDWDESQVMYQLRMWLNDQKEIWHDADEKQKAASLEARLAIWIQAAEDQERLDAIAKGR